MRNASSTNRHAKYRVGLLSLLFVLIAFLLGACRVLEDAPGLDFGEVDNLQIGMVESSGFNSTEAHFHTLTGRKSWRENLREGDTFSLEYDASLEKGSLLLQVENSQGEVIWEKTVAEGESAGEEMELTAGESGTYTIAVVGDDAGGEYELAWEQAE